MTQTVTNQAGYEMERARSWAFGAIHRPPMPSDWMGLDYSTCSRRMTAMCEAGAQTGRTLAASHHLDMLRTQIEREGRIQQIAMNSNDGVNLC